MKTDMSTAGGHVMTHDKYRLGKRLGSGGMADVFRAEITGAQGFSRPVAIKRLHAGVSADSDFCAMFVREAQLLATLQHPNIVSVLDFEWDAEGRLFLVMELVDGINLAQLVHRGQLPVPAALHVMSEVLRGLGHAHSRGILHRDVTPHNVLLAWTGEVKLSDFGLAQVSASSRVSDRGTIRGKVPYLSPEQLPGLTIDARSDRFSIGVMFYQLLTGHYPFFGRGDHPTVAESIARMLTATIVPPRDLRPEIPLELSDVIMKLLARDREHRYADTEQVLAALPAAIEGRKAVAALLAERFPDSAAREPEPEPGARAATDAIPSQGQRPAAQRHTMSLQGGPERAASRATGRPPAWRRAGLLLALGGLLCAAAVCWPLDRADQGDDQAIRTMGPAVAGTRLHEAEAAGPAAGALPGHANAGVAPASPAPSSSAPASSAPLGAWLPRLEATTTSVASCVDAPAPATPHARGALARRRPVRLSAPLQASEQSTRPDTWSDTAPAGGVETDAPPGAATDALAVPAPDETREGPVTRRYERGWTEALPQQAVTGESPLRRREQRGGDEAPGPGASAVSRAVCCVVWRVVWRFWPWPGCSWPCAHASRTPSPRSGASTSRPTAALIASAYTRRTSRCSTFPVRSSGSSARTPPISPSRPRIGACSCAPWKKRRPAPWPISTWSPSNRW